MEIKTSRRMKGVEEELERCAKILDKKFHPVYILTPGYNSHEVMYGGLCLTTSKREIIKLKKELRKVGSNRGCPGTIAVYKSPEQKEHFLIELKPYVVNKLEDLVENTQEIAEHLRKIITKNS